MSPRQVVKAVPRSARHPTHTKARSAGTPPWLVSFLADGKPDFCGVLIGPRRVLTVNHAPWARNQDVYIGGRGVGSRTDGYYEILGYDLRVVGLTDAVDHEVKEPSLDAGKDLVVYPLTGGPFPAVRKDDCRTRFTCPICKVYRATRGRNLALCLYVPGHPVANGDSGGPAIDSGGNLIGLLVASNAECCGSGADVRAILRTFDEEVISRIRRATPR